MNGVDFLVALSAVALVAVTVYRKVFRSKKSGCACDGCDACRGKARENRR
ncbi:MAG: FeoB-associated Cys-rich membrane protein [Synergistaceae bacterium]|jgi:hypothetical protein|nr:FeoB-associated Cys-rich membrane protein [Synergistaceae bacterium]